MQLKWHRSNSTKVRNDVPLGFVLVPLLFVIFIDNIDEEVLREISKFSDNTKKASRVNTLNNIRLSMQRTLEKFGAWANRWEMDFNVNKCGAMHIEKRNLKVSVPDE